jgi:hypothetical protein
VQETARSPHRPHMLIWVSPDVTSGTGVTGVVVVDA